MKTNQINERAVKPRRFPWAALAFGAPIAAFALTSDQDGFNAGASNNSVSSKSIAVGSSNTATGSSLAVGMANDAQSYSLAAGYGNTTYAYNAAVGMYNSLTSYQSIAIGYGNSVDGSSSVILGYANTVGGYNSTVRGSYNIVDASNSHVLGNEHTAGSTASRSILVGESLVGEAHTVTLGRFNESSGTSDTVVAIGSGTSEYDRGNAMEIREGGRIVINEVQGDISMGIYQ